MVRLKKKEVINHCAFEMRASKKKKHIRTKEDKTTKNRQMWKSESEIVFMVKFTPFVG